MKSSKLSGLGYNGNIATKRAGGLRRNTSLTLVRIVGCSLECSKTKKGGQEWCGCWQLRRFRLNDTRRFVQKPIPTPPPGNRILRNDLMCRWSHDFKEGDGYSTSGRNKLASAQSAIKRSRKLQGGIAIMSYGDQKGD